ncbi:hypothetical protein [uncultured Dysgonomonas sp.]|uniref:Uncharacterized protein n=1 Tax=uncultured Dysgonomonas sp. TaxID=206096 RepID=A0A212J398_9BACT|nr:hypothetical protein [uncultured Dysgonomonas sp.]SBV93942.1 conserved exported hypothetical protein [uncultured Dysgonomonas sp.]
MKKFLLAFALFIGVTSFYNTVEAQNINISINIGRQPAWGPVGYDYVGYYYFPDIDCYYDVNVGLFYYFDRGRWISARYLPYGYRNYDLYGLYKVVLNVREPWRYHHIHYRDYARYRGHRNQIVIRDSRDYRYRDSRNNRVTWYSDNRKEHKYNSGRPNNNYNNNRKDNNYRPDNNYNRKDNNRKDNYDNNRNKDKNYNNSQRKNDNKRSEYGTRDNRSNRNDNVKSRPSKSRDDNRSSKATQSSSGRSDFRMASNTGSQRSNNR